MILAAALSIIAAALLLAINTEIAERSPPSHPWLEPPLPD
jgi:hypothetical protein